MREKPVKKLDSGPYFGHIFSSIYKFNFIYKAPNHNKCHLKALQRYSSIQGNYNPTH